MSLAILNVNREPCGRYSVLESKAGAQLQGTLNLAGEEIETKPMSEEDHIGRSEIAEDTADPARLARLAATLDRSGPPWVGDVLPPLGHWLCFQPDAPQSALGEDGHPLRTGGGLLPEIDLPRRMWAGSRIRFLRDIPMGSPIVRRSTLAASEPKTGRSGRMHFVTVLHEIGTGDGDPAISEEQDLVYREAPAAGAAMERVAIPVEEIDDEKVRQVRPDPVMLFRYSALTFNSHRIHYDEPYATKVENYPGLVVQGPLLATLLMDRLLHEAPGRRVASFSFRASAPLFSGEQARLGCAIDGNEVRLRAVGPYGLCMTAQAECG